MKSFPQKVYDGFLFWLQLTMFLRIADRIAHRRCPLGHSEKMCLKYYLWC